ncbi:MULTISPECIES: alkaline phosphatase family protein [Kitasatospora]|uniref:alkaline phosphatase family protein n=1 Tax=Kitasatospora TaxID=2063 RepID=UPI000CC193B2|nr:alkaline phosphatase family protein [Kitasatospora sp. GP30]MDH6139189.1 phospholipase C [Kitasatospora sp. GP30]
MAENERGRCCGSARGALLRRRDRWRARLVEGGAGWCVAARHRLADWRRAGPGLRVVPAGLGELGCRLAEAACGLAGWLLYWALTGVSRLLPGRLQGTASERIQHVFVLVLENRSFDHMLGAATGAVSPDGELRPGIGVDPVTGAATTVDGPGEQRNSHAGTDYRIRLGAPFVLPVDPPHEFCDVRLQLAGAPISGSPHDDRCTYTGEYPPIDLSGFVQNYANEAAVKHSSADPGAVMACFTDRQVPVLATLAREFALCDRWFSALPGPTWPNRFFLHAASSAGLDRSPDPLETIGSKLAGYHFEHGTIYEALDAKGLPWRVYSGDALPQVSALAGMDLPVLLTRYHHVADLAGHLSHRRYDAAYTFIEPSYGHVLTHGADFQGGSSQHPLDDVTRGEALIKQVYEAIRQSPHWESSLLVITYDEHGGFYDHVPPPTAVPPGDVIDPENNAHGFRFDRQGVRVPAVVVSPWVPDLRSPGVPGQNCNLVDHTQYDHGSLLATVEQLFGLEPLTQRDRHANTFAHLLSARAPRPAPRTLPDPAESGFRLDDSGPGDDRLAAAADPAVAERPLTATMRGFVETAAILHARLHPDQHEQVRQRIGAITTVGEAARYLVEVRGRLNERGVRTARPGGAGA